MGYYTRFELEIRGAGERWVTGVDVHGEKVTVNIGVDHPAIKQEIATLSGYSSLFEGDTHKWYDHDEHMRTVSKLYPDLLFVLSGEGEEANDLWVKYYKGGQAQIAKATITYDQFDEGKLQ